MARPIAYAGELRQIVYAKALDGTHPALEFFDGLPLKIKTAFAVSFRRLGDTGKIFNKEQFKAIEGTQFFEFKRDRFRLICRFTDGGLVLLTNGCEKKKDKLNPEDIKRAQRIYEEDERVFRNETANERGKP